ncbi:MAG: DUF975 family protein [Sarcina sp.]
MRAQIKQVAKNQLRGRWGRAVLAFFISTLVTLIGTLILNFLGVAIGILGVFASLLISAPMGLGLCIYTLNFINNKEDLEDVFCGFQNMLKVLGVLALQSVIIWVGTLLLIIPGIIAGLYLSQTMFILADKPDIGVIDCLKESYNMMKGRLWEYFVLELSFLGWAILAMITFGIGYLFFIPYNQVTLGNYYLLIKGDGKKEDIYDDVNIF